jgi:hypothetical protein
MGRQWGMLHDVCCRICQSVVWRRCCVSRARILPSRSSVRRGTCWGQQLGPKLTGWTLAHGFPKLASEWLWGLLSSPLGLSVATHGTAFRRLAPRAQRTGAAAAARTHSALPSLSRHSRSRTAVCVALVSEGTATRNARRGVKGTSPSCHESRRSNAAPCPNTAHAHRCVAAGLWDTATQPDSTPSGPKTRPPTHVCRCTPSPPHHSTRSHHSCDTPLMRHQSHYASGRTWLKLVGVEGLVLTPAGQLSAVRAPRD